MSTVTLELNVKEAKNLIKQMAVEDKIKLMRELEQETWAKRLDEVVQRIRKGFKQNPISDKEITRICEETRQGLYNERTKGRN